MDNYQFEYCRFIWDYWSWTRTIGLNILGLFGIFDSFKWFTRNTLRDHCWFMRFILGWKISLRRIEFLASSFGWMFEFCSCHCFWWSYSFYHSLFLFYFCVTLHGDLLLLWKIVLELKAKVGLVLSIFASQSQNLFLKFTKSLYPCFSNAIRRFWLRQ